MRNELYKRLRSEEMVTPVARETLYGRNDLKIPSTSRLFSSNNWNQGFSNNAYFELKI